MVQRIRQWPPYRRIRDCRWGDFIMFSCVGIFVTSIDVGIFLLLVHNSPFFASWYLFANALGFIIAVLISFLLHRRLTFRSKNRMDHEFLRFFVVACIGLCVSEVMLYIAQENIFHIWALSKIFAVLCATLFTFFANKHWTFSHRGDFCTEYVAK